MADQLLCLSCPLPSCNENDKRCFYYKPRFADNEGAQIKAQRRDLLLQVTELDKRLAEINRDGRRPYYKEHYRANRERRLAAANARNAARRDAN